MTLLDATAILVAVLIAGICAFPPSCASSKTGTPSNESCPLPHV